MAITPKPFQIPLHVEKCRIHLEKFDGQTRFVVSLSATEEEIRTLMNTFSEEALMRPLTTAEHDLSRYLVNALTRAVRDLK